jgi:hypothetical protein
MLLSIAEPAGTAVSGGPVDRMDARKKGPASGRPGSASPSEADLGRGLDADDLALVDRQEDGAELDLLEGASYDRDRILVAEVGLLGGDGGCFFA